MISCRRHCWSPSRMEGQRVLFRILNRCYRRTTNISAGIRKQLTFYAPSWWNWAWKMWLKIYGDKNWLYVFYWEAQALRREFRECFARIFCPIRANWREFVAKKMYVKTTPRAHGCCEAPFGPCSAKD